MLWSLTKIILFVVIVSLLTLGAGYLLEAEGGVRIAFGGMEFNLGPLQSVVGALLLVLAIWILMKVVGFLVAILRFINGDETAISRYFDRSRERKGFKALSDGMLALASGEGREAMKKADQADKYLNRPELTNLITAQAAEMIGDKKTADRVYKELLKDQRTRFVGVRGLMKQRMSEGNNEVALKLAETAFAIKPKHEETQDLLLRLQAESGDWKGARKTLATKLKTGTLPRDVHKRRDAVLALSEAKVVIDENATIEAREEAIEANRLSPDLIPAAAMAARGYIAKGKPKYATRVIKKAWDVTPHPDLAEVFAEIQPNETPAQRIKRFGLLTNSHQDNPETKMLLAELNIAAEDFPAARRALGDLAQSDPNTRTLTLMAAVERGEGAEDAVVRGWLARAVTAPRGPSWICDSCNHIHGDWVPVCENCGGFDTLTWRKPPAQMMSTTGLNAEMLPLIVGSPREEANALVPVTEPAADADVVVEEAQVVDAATKDETSK